MKFNVSIIRRLVPGAIALTILALSACADSQNEDMRLPEVASSADAAAAQPDGRVRLEGLRFKSDSASLRSDSKPILDEAAEILRQEPDGQVYVDAYYNRFAHIRANQQLAQRRAEKVKECLATRGVAATRMIARGFAMENPANNGALGVSRRNSTVDLVTFPAVAPPAANFAYSPLETSKVN